MTQGRLLGIIYYLLGNGHAIAPALAEKFEVSIRTIYRDVDRLSSVGIPIYCNSGKGGGIFLLDSFVLDKSLLSAQEQEELLLSVQGLQTLREEHQVLEKLQALFQIKMDNWLQIDFTDWRGQKYHQETFEQIKRGIFQRWLLQFDYLNQQGEGTSRWVEPMQLIFKSQDWYLYGFCRRKQDYRLFKLSRINHCQLSTEIFDRELRQADFQSKESQKETIRLQLKFEKHRAFRVYEEFSGLISTDVVGNLLVEAEFPNHDSLYAYLSSFLDGVEVLGPPEVRQKLAKKLNEISQKYKS